MKLKKITLISPENMTKFQPPLIKAEKKYERRRLSNKNDEFLTFYGAEFS